MIGNTYHYGSEIQTIADRFLVGYGHEGDWHIPNVKVVSMYVESRARISGGRWQTAWAGIVAAGARGSAATSHSRA